MRSSLTSLTGCLLAATAAAQTLVPIPPHASIYNGYSRGYNFTAATNFIIAQLDLPLDAFQAGDTASYLVRKNGAVALYSTGNPGLISTNILVNTGDVIDVIGNWSPAAPNNFTAHNSYGNTSPYATTIEGVPHTLMRTGWQWDIGAPGYAGTYLTPTTGQLGRVLMYTTPQSGLFANFSANVTSGASPLAVNFTDGSFSSDPGGIVAWAWDFDGDSVIDSTQQNPSFVYANCGTYNVTLTVVDGSHPPSTLTKTAYITTDAIAADFTAQVVGPLTVQFTDTSNMPATSWAWDLNGDTIVDSTAQNPAWVYASLNPVNVTLTVTRLCAPPSSITKSVIPAQQLTTNLAANNGVGTPATLYFNLNVLNPGGVNIGSFDSISSTLNSPFTVDWYLKLGTYSGFELNAAPWTWVGQASGTTNPVANQPSNATFAQPLHLPQGSYGVAIRFVGAYPRYVTLTAPTTYANGDLSLTAGSASLSTAGPFTGTNLNSPRGWSGTIYYGTHNVTGGAGYGFFAPGCAGSMGVSHLTSNLPQLGSTLNVNLSNLPQSIAIMMIGFSNTASVFGPLPIDVTPFGAPGCFGRVSTDATAFLLGAGNTATWSFTIPNDPSLSGLKLYNQGLVLDPGFNALGAVFSDAAGMILGL